MFGVLARVEHDLHRDALHHLHVVARGVFRRQQAEARAGGARDTVDCAAELPAAKGIHFQFYLLPGAHLRELVFLVIRHHPEVVCGDQGQQGRPRLDNLPRLDALLANDAADRRTDDGALHVQFRGRDGGLHLRHLGRRGRGAGAGRGHLLRPRFGGLDFGFHARRP